MGFVVRVPAAQVCGRPPRCPSPLARPLRSSRCTLRRALASAREKYGEDVFEPASGEPDVVVIGAGIGGLCCAALAASYGMSVTVLESHDVPGGAAHPSATREADLARARTHTHTAHTAHTVA